MLAHIYYAVTTPSHAFLRYFPYTTSWYRDRKRDAAWKAVDDVLAPHVLDVLLSDDGGDSVGALRSLLEHQPRFRESIESLTADVRVLILAGFETTAHGLAIAMSLLASHPKLAHEIAIEGRAVWDDLHRSGASNLELADALERAPAARHFFLETIRLYPLVHTLAGRCLEDITVQTALGQEYCLAKGTKILFANMVLNRQCENGHVFDPSRWNNPELPFFNTFNTGSHVCPGKPLALLEAHVCLLLVATRFAFSHTSTHDANLEFCNSVVLKPHNLNLTVLERPEGGSLVA
jgi:cytochrome P450/NADPH-cytochrome P450 reductase